MSFDDDERSARLSRPRDLYIIVTPTRTYRITSHVTNVDYAGDTYTAITMDRGSLHLGTEQTGKELVVYLPITHELVQRFCAFGIPEHSVSVTYLRFQEVSGTAQQQYSGFATGISIDGHMAALRVPSLMDDAMKIQLPVIGANKSCNHVLFDGRCSRIPGVDGPNPSLFTYPVTFSSQTIAVGSVTVAVSDAAGQSDGWFKFGTLIHVPTGQRRYIVNHVGVNMALNTPLVGAVTGDAITLIVGCDHTMITCRDKFANRVNFGGMPFMNNEVNPWLPNGLGSIQNA